MARDIFADSRRRTRNRFLKKAVIFLIATALLGVSFISFFYIPYFKIKKISIAGAETIRISDIETSIKNFISGREYFVFPRSSVFFLSEDMIVEHLVRNFPRLKRAYMKIDEIAPASLLISLEERTIWAVVCRKESCFYASEDGFLFEPAPRISGTLFLKIEDERSENYEIGEGFIDTSELERIKTLFEKIKLLTDKKLDSLLIKKDEIYYYEASSDLGWKIIFDSKSDPLRAAENFALAYKNTLGEDLSKVDYIDLRFENRIFYKEK